jgi:hypothetical protein
VIRFFVERKTSLRSYCGGCASASNQASPSPVLSGDVRSA